MHHRFLKLLRRGEGGIRTHGTREGPIVFKTIAIVHSATSPSALGRSRTYDLRIRSPLLYPLSYERIVYQVYQG